jgi:hypothetical protein
MKLTVLDKVYDGESLYDVVRDLEESLNEQFNPIVAQIPKDQYNLQLGRFRITVEWTDGD